MQPCPVQARVEISPRGQLVTPGTDVGYIDQRLGREWALKAERPAFGVRDAKVLFERAELRIQQAGWAGGGSRELGKPVGRAPPCRQCSDFGKNCIWRGG